MAEVEVAATLAGLSQLQVRLDGLMRDVVEELATDVQKYARIITESFLGEYPERSTTLPGTLRDSILVRGPQGAGDGKYFAVTGPHVVYGAQREFGGPIYKKPGNSWGMNFYFLGRVYSGMQKVNQEKYPAGRYLSPAGRLVASEAENIVTSRLTLLIEGG
jgi:hypothetical protein